MTAKQIITLILFILMLVLLLQNLLNVEIHLLFWSVSVPQAVLILVVLVSGCIIGYLLSSIQKHTKTKKPDEKTS